MLFCNPIFFLGSSKNNEINMPNSRIFVISIKIFAQSDISNPLGYKKKKRVGFIFYKISEVELDTIMIKTQPTISMNTPNDNLCRAYSLRESFPKKIISASSCLLISTSPPIPSTLTHKKLLEFMLNICDMSEGSSWPFPS